MGPRRPPSLHHRWRLVAFVDGRRGGRRPCYVCDHCGMDASAATRSRWHQVPPCARQQVIGWVVEPEREAAHAEWSARVAWWRAEAARVRAAASQPPGSTIAAAAPDPAGERRAAFLRHLSLIHI